MAVDLTTSKPGTGAVYPEGAVDSGFRDGDPLVDPPKLIRLHLFGIPLRSAIRDPISGRAQEMTPDDVKEFIREAVGLAELETGLDFFPKQYEEWQPYDQPQHNSFGFTVLDHRPGESVQALTVTSTDGVKVWDIPLTWVQTAYLRKGQINLMPFAMGSAAGTSLPIGANGPIGLLPNLFKQNWVPAVWKVTYTTGFPDGKLPVVVNQLIAVVAAMEILSALATTYSRSTGGSLSIDGLSQSQSFPGPQIFKQRLDDLGPKRKFLVNRLRALYGARLFSSNV